jgi:hydroxymethylbilane synthase
MERNCLRIGSRESPLALAQTQLVMDQLQAAWPGLILELKTYKTQGDLILDTALSKIGDKGLFVKELEQALHQQEIDIAIHSAKDLPSDLPLGLTAQSVGEREDPRDVLITLDNIAFSSLPLGAVVGTSSLRRIAQLKRLRPDLNYQTIRGNLQTRLQKMEAGAYQAIILAAAGVHRLGWRNRIGQYFHPHQEMIPAVAQGILAVEFRNSDSWTQEKVERLTIKEVEITLQAERAFLRTLEGGCQLPLAAYAQPGDEGSFTLQAIVLDPEGAQVLRGERSFQEPKASQAGEELAQALLHQGAREILMNLQAVPSAAP